MQRHRTYTILFLQAQGWFHSGLSDSQSRFQCSHPCWCPWLHPLSECYCFKSCLVARCGHRWKQIAVLWSLYRGRCWQKGQEGVGEAGSMGSCHSLGSERWILPFGIAPCWDTSSSMHFWRSQKYLLIPKKAYRLQLHVVNFNRKVCVVFRSCGPGVFPTSHFCLNQTSAQPAHTYPGVNLKQPWQVNGIIPGLSVQQKEISMNKTIFFSF